MQAGRRAVEANVGGEAALAGLVIQRVQIRALMHEPAPDDAVNEFGRVIAHKIGLVAISPGADD